MDLYTPNPDVQRRTGRAIRDRRGAFVLQAHLCAVWEDGQYRATRRIDEVRAAFETMLANLGTDYVDVGMIHYVDSPALWREIAEGPVMAYARELRRAGRIRHIGVSSHNPEAALAAVESGLVEVLMFSVNPCYDLQPPNEDVEQLWAPDNYSGGLTNMDPTRERLYETCQRMGVGITVMKAFGGGDLLSGELSPAGKALTPVQCLHYAATRRRWPRSWSARAAWTTCAPPSAYETASDGERVTPRRSPPSRGSAGRGHWHVLADTARPVRRGSTWRR